MDVKIFIQNVCQLGYNYCINRSKFPKNIGKILEKEAIWTVKQQLFKNGYVLIPQAIFNTFTLKDIKVLLDIDRDLYTDDLFIKYTDEYYNELLKRYITYKNSTND